ncbi:MAG: zinc carboxypeptidase [Halobacteriovoraceae bacterium]|nr:zinc carboxypeptidase [Halobacteriovoraceae bacterium]
MKMLIFILLFSSNLFAQNYFVELKAKDSNERTKLAEIIHIDQVLGDRVYSVMNEKHLKYIQENFPKQIVQFYMIKDEHVHDGLSVLSDEIEFPKGDEPYHTYDEVLDELNTLSKKYSNISELITIGQSVEGREIPALIIKNKSLWPKESLPPGTLIVGTHHAREHLSTEIPLLAINYLLKNYQSDEEIKNLIDNREIIFIPMLNPDGVIHDIKGKKYKYWRKNRQENHSGDLGVDLNRNYSFMWGTGGSSSRTWSDTYMGPHPFSEPETQAIRKIVDEKPNLRVLLSVHTFGEMILYPWGHKTEDVVGKDGLVFKKMAQDMAKWNKYSPMRGIDLYKVSGDTCDWAYGEKGIFCFTFELSPRFSRSRGNFYPGTSIIESTFRENLNPILYLIKNSADPYSVIE